MKNKLKTETVINRFWDGFIKNNVQQILDQYSENAFLATPIGVLRGKSEIADYWEFNSQNLPEGFIDSVKILTKETKGETAYLTYEASPFISLVSNTWLVQDDHIVSHTLVSSEPLKFGQEFFSNRKDKTADVPNDLATLSSNEVFYNHLKGFRNPDGKWLANNFSEDGFIITPLGTVTGHKEIADYLDYVFGNAPEEYLKIGSGITQYVEGQTAVVVYEKSPIVEMGSDTWHIANGKLISQTYTSYPVMDVVRNFFRQYRA